MIGEHKPYPQTHNFGRKKRAIQDMDSCSFYYLTKDIVKQMTGVPSRPLILRPNRPFHAFAPGYQVPA